MYENGVVFYPSTAAEELHYIALLDLGPPGSLLQRGKTSVFRFEQQALRLGRVSGSGGPIRARLTPTCLPAARCVRGKNRRGAGRSRHPQRAWLSSFSHTRAQNRQRHPYTPKQHITKTAYNQHGSMRGREKLLCSVSPEHRTPLPTSAFSPSYKFQSGPCASRPPGSCSEPHS